MNRTLIANTPKHLMHALVYQGIIVSDCHVQIQDMIRTRLGDEYTLLFAEPVVNSADNSIDWYTPVQGEIQKLKDSPNKQMLMEKIGHMAEDIHSFAEELRKSPENSRAGRGYILNLALQYPDENSLYLVGDQPVLTCWGFGPGTLGAKAQDLSRMLEGVKPFRTPLQQETHSINSSETNAVNSVNAAAHTANSTANSRTGITPDGTAQKVTYQEKPGSSWAWWLLPFFLLLLLVALLLSSFCVLPALSGKSLLHVPCFLPHDKDNANIRILKEQQSKLKADIQALQNKLKNRAELCVPDPAPGITEPIIPPKPVTEPTITEPVTPEPEKVPAETAPVLPENPEPLVIPENAENMEFVSGVWRSDLGVINSRTGKPIVMDYAFNANGDGELTVYEDNGLCTGKVKAGLEKGTLTLNVDKQTCNNGSFFQAETILCKNENGIALCTGSSESSPSSWTLKFYRVK